MAEDYTRSQSQAFWKRQQQPAQSNTVPLPFVSNGIKCFAAGDVKFRTVAGDDDTITIPAGWVAGGHYIIDTQVDLIYDTGTTLTDAQMRIGV